MSDTKPRSFDCDLKLAEWLLKIEVDSDATGVLVRVAKTMAEQAVAHDRTRVYCYCLHVWLAVLTVVIAWDWLVGMVEWLT